MLNKIIFPARHEDATEDIDLVYPIDTISTVVVRSEAYADGTTPNSTYSIMGSDDGISAQALNHEGSAVSLDAGETTEELYVEQWAFLHIRTSSKSTRASEEVAFIVTGVTRG